MLCTSCGPCTGSHSHASASLGRTQLGQADAEARTSPIGKCIGSVFLVADSVVELIPARQKEDRKVERKVAGSYRRPSGGRRRSFNVSVLYANC